MQPHTPTWVMPLQPLQPQMDPDEPLNSWCPSNCGRCFRLCKQVQMMMMIIICDCMMNDDDGDGEDDGDDDDLGLQNNDYYDDF